MKNAFLVLCGLGTILTAGWLVFGQPKQLPFDPKGQMKLEQGTYFIVVREPILVQGKIDAVPLKGPGPSFFHDGKRKDDGTKHCGGEIIQSLKDNGTRVYLCSKCKQQWEGKINAP